VTYGHNEQQEGGGILAPRQQQILELIWQGLSNREIASHLMISIKTVEAHRASLMKRLRTTNTAQTIQVGINLGLIEVGTRWKE